MQGVTDETVYFSDGDEKNIVKELYSLTDNGRVFQARAAAPGKERSPGVLHRMEGASKSILSVE